MKKEDDVIWSPFKTPSYASGKELNKYPWKLEP